MHQTLHSFSHDLHPPDNGTREGRNKIKREEKQEINEEKNCKAISTNFYHLYMMAAAKLVDPT